MKSHEDPTIKPATRTLRIAVILQAALLLFVILVALNMGT